MKIRTGMLGWMARWAVLFAIVLSGNYVFGQARVPWRYYRNAAAVSEHYHPDKLPTTKEIWNSCCHENDCREAPLTVSFIDKETVEVAIADFKPFRMNASRVYPSKNGKSYFCTWGAVLPPTKDTIICVFYVKPSMVDGGKTLPHKS